MDKKQQVEQLTTYMANFVSYIGKVLPNISMTSFWDFDIGEENACFYVFPGFSPYC